MISPLAAVEADCVFVLPRGLGAKAGWFRQTVVLLQENAFDHQKMMAALFPQTVELLQEIAVAHRAMLEPLEVEWPPRIVAN